MSDMLKEFFAEYDIESLRCKVLEEEGVDICGVYCLATGKEMGFYNHEEILFAIDEIGVDDEEALIDDLLVRVVASMRPSPALNMPNRFTIQQMVEKRPVDAFAYLANRLHGTRNLLTKRSETSFEPLLGRIVLHARWTKLHAAGVDLTPWTHWLLELDAKMNLHDIEAPGFGEHKQPLLTQVTIDNQAEMLKAFESWVFDRLAAYDKRDSEMLKESNWIRGNSFTGSAYVRSWIENPEIANRKHAEQVKNRKKKASPGRKPTSARTQALNSEVDKFLHLLEGIMDGVTETPPVPVKPKPRVLLGGMLKLNIAKKEG